MEREMKARSDMKGGHIIRVCWLMRRFSPESERYGLSCGVERCLLAELTLSMHAVSFDMSLAH